MNFIGPNIMGLEAGDPAIILAGGHVGCFELVGTDRVQSIRDLKGKTVAWRLGALSMSSSVRWPRTWASTPDGTSPA